MSFGKSFVLVAAGALAGIAFLLSCSDDAPGTADAATCDCPAAEPPITGRIVRVANTKVIPANTTSGEGVSCPQDATLLSGSCTQANINPTHDIIVQEGGFYGTTDQAWNCTFKNNEAVDVEVKVSAICLNPAP